MERRAKDSDQAAGVPLVQAAGLLGISTDALRKRIRRGSIEAHKRDGQWYVVLDNDRATGVPPSQPFDQDIMARLMDQLAEKDRQIEREQAANAELRILLQRALERPPMIELPNTVIGSNAEAPPPSEKRRRWWHALVWG